MSENVATNPLPIEIQQQMAMAFGEPVPATPVVAAPPAPSNVSEPPAPSAPPAASDAAAPPAPVVDDNIVYVDPNEYLKQNLGWDNWDVAKQELQALRERAQTPAEIKYANDEAKRWAEYFISGKEDELYQSLHARQQVKNIDTLSDEQKIKLYIKMQNPLFQQQHIDYQFKRDYGFDESQFKDEDGNVIDQIGLDYAKISAQQKMQNDLSRASEYFTQYKSKIELPEIKPQVAQSIDEEYESYKASTAKSLDAYNNTVVPALKALSEADVNMAFNVNDPNNQMQFDLGIAVDKGDFDTAREEALNLSDWINNSFYDDKGNFQPKNLIRATLLYKNFDKYAQTIARQAVNAERKRMIEKEAPNPSIRRDFNIDPTLKTEFDNKMNMALSV